MEKVLSAFRERHPRSRCVGAVLANWGNGLKNKQRHSSLVGRSSGQQGSNLPTCTLTENGRGSVGPAEKHREVV